MRDAVVFPSIKRFRMYRQKRFEYTTGGHVFKNIRILVDGAKVNNHVGKSLRRAIIQQLSPLVLLDF